MGIDRSVAAPGRRTGPRRLRRADPSWHRRGGAERCLPALLPGGGVRAARGISVRDGTAAGSAGAERRELVDAAAPALTADGHRRSLGGGPGGGGHGSAALTGHGWSRGEPSGDRGGDDPTHRGRSRADAGAARIGETSENCLPGGPANAAHIRAATRELGRRTRGSAGVTGGAGRADSAVAGGVAAIGRGQRGGEARARAAVLRAGGDEERREC